MVDTEKKLTKSIKMASEFKAIIEEKDNEVH